MLWRRTYFFYISALILFLQCQLHAQTTTVGDGGDPQDVTIAPGGSATMLNSFTLQTDFGTSELTQVSVTFSGGISVLALVEITDDTGSVVYGTKNDPSFSPVNISLTTTITATTSLVQYKVRITPDTHDLMSPPPGSEMGVYGRVQEIQPGGSGNCYDDNSGTVTIDNQSPDFFFWGPIVDGDGQIDLAWTNPVNADFDEVIIGRSATLASDRPKEGTNYIVNDTIGDYTIVYAGGDESFSDSNVVNLSSYYYRAFAQDTNGNYSWTPATGPHVPWGMEVEDGTDPSDSEIAPGGSAIVLDVFELRVPAGMATVTAVTVTLESGMFSRISSLEIINDAGSIVHGSVNPAGDVVAVSLSSNINVSSTPTPYKVRITPETHANMPAPPGAAYAITGLVTAVTSDRDELYMDGGGTTVTIDNLSPGEASWGVVTFGDAQVELNWSNPGDPDFNSVIILRNTSAVSDAPAEGNAYSQGNAIGASTVIYAGGLTTFTDTTVTNFQNCYYKIFARDDNGNWSASGVGDGPHVPRVIALSTNSVRLGVDVRSQLAGVAVDGQTVLSMGDATGTFFDGIAAGVGQRVHLDALLVHSNLIIFSTDVDCVIDAATYRDEDLIAYNANAGTFSIFFDGSAAGIPAGEDIDAASFERGYAPTNLLLSFDTDVTLPGPLSVTDDDIVRYASGVFTKLYDGTGDLGIPAAADVNALHHDYYCLYVSLDITTSINGAGADEDVWFYDAAASGMTLISGLGLEQRVDLECLDQPTDSDDDWLSDFEEASGIDEAATLYPGTNSALSPGGYVSFGDVADSDGDGFHDGIEAACGTDPLNPYDMLKLLAITDKSGTNACITWRTADGRNYAILNTAVLANGFTNTIEALYSAASGTNVTVYTNMNATGASPHFYRIRLIP